MKDYPVACEAATAALEKGDPQNVKALFRRGLARNHLGLPDEAIVDLSRALEVDPTNKPVKVSTMHSCVSVLLIKIARQR